MKRKIRMLSLLLTAALLAAIPPAALALEANPAIRAGLLFGANALPGVNLENHTGSGYRFGYLENGHFVEVGRTQERKISMIKNRDVWVTGTNTYSDSVTTDILIGSFHDEDGLKPSRAEAETRAAELRAAGQTAFVYYEKGAWGVRVNSYVASSQNIASKKTGSRYCISVVVTGTNDIIFQYDSGGLDQSLVVAPDITGEERPQTWFRDYRYTGLFEYSRREENNITVINLVDMQEYIKGVIPYEMSASWHLEALKAQSVAARTYARRNINKHTSAGFNICNTVHCQVYRGANRANANSDRAVDETYGEYVTYRGMLCDTVYSASSGGATEDSENVWGSRLEYLRGVFDIHEDITRISNGRWSRTTDNAALSDHLTQRGFANAGIVDFYVSAYTRMGNVMEITMVDAAGQSFTFARERTRTFIGFPSQRYSVGGSLTGLVAIGAGGTLEAVEDDRVWIIGQNGELSQMPLGGDLYIRSASGVGELPKPERGGELPGVYVVNGRGNGHNVGMSQWGALHMAEKGFTYQEILTFYYTGVTVEKGAS
ncbi:MAG: SpoIID/LytB domain-containing protein [Oscillospiraceae bacterium]|nr:SpoIID/LytB domain-containing protein [Oscillospiraceae bacterium]